MIFLIVLAGPKGLVRFVNYLVRSMAAVGIAMVGAVALGATVGAQDAAAAALPAAGPAPQPTATAAVLHSNTPRSSSLQDFTAALAIGMMVSPYKCMLI